MGVRTAIDSDIAAQRAGVAFRLTNGARANVVLGGVLKTVA